MDHQFDVKALRERIGWTQERLARYLRIDRTSVSHMENGRPVRGPIDRLLEALSRAADAGVVEQVFPDDKQHDVEAAE